MEKKWRRIRLLHNSQEAVDFLDGVVSMRTQPQSPSPLIHNDARVPAASFQFIRIPARSRQRHDPGLLARRAAAEYLEARARREFTQVIGQTQDSPLEFRDARVQQEPQTGAHRVNPRDIGRSAFPALGTRLEPVVDFTEIKTVDDAVPAHANRVQHVDQLRPNPEDANPLRPEQPLVTVGRQEVDRCPSNIEREDAEALNRIDEEVDPALATHRTDRIQVVAKAAGEFDETQRHNPGSCIHRGANIVDGDPAAATRHRAHAYAAMPLIDPWILIRRVFLRREHNIVAFPPWKAFRDPVDAVARILDEGDFGRIGVEELSREPAHFFDAIDPVPDGGDAVGGEVVGILFDRDDGGSRQRRDGGVVEESPASRHRKLASKLVPIHGMLLVVNCLPRRGNLQSMTERLSQRDEKTRPTVIFDEQRPTSWDLNFRVFRVPVRVSPWFWLVTVFLGWEYIRLGPEYLLIWVLCVFVSILLHELGHVWMGQVFGNYGHIVMQSFCGLAIGANGQSERWKRIVVSLAGPGIQLLFVALLLTGLHLIDQRSPRFIEETWLLAKQEYAAGDIDYFHSIMNPIFAVQFQPNWPAHLQTAVFFLIEINLYWALVNLLPIWPLDGGMVSRELFLWHSRNHGVRNSLALSLATALIVVVNSLSMMISGPGIPYMPSGGRFFVWFFAWFAFENFMYLRAEQARTIGGWSDPGEDRMPWERDPDEWKRGE